MRKKKRTLALEDIRIGSNVIAVGKKGPFNGKTYNIYLVEQININGDGGVTLIGDFCTIVPHRGMKLTNGYFSSTFFNFELPFDK